MAPPDLLVHDEGSIYLLRSTSRRGKQWIDENVPDGGWAWAGAIVVELRFIGTSLQLCGYPSPSGGQL